jgi:6-phosphofructo-2-kinase
MALDDFRARICKYEEVYETITNRDLHYIKLIDMCAAPMSMGLTAPHHIIRNSKPFCMWRLLSSEAAKTQSTCISKSVCAAMCDPACVPLLAPG